MAPTEIEERKQKEAEFHDELRSAALKADPEKLERLTSNRKYYSVARKSKEFFEAWLIRNCRGKKVLDYGCGDAPFSFLVAGHGAEVTGIDISQVSVENCKAIAAEKGLSDRAEFRVMDCERLDFPPDSFDVVFVAGVLHHLELEAALREISRVLKPDGKVIAYEALGHNPLFQLYRRLTPHLRTAFETEHILKVESLRRARKYFGRVSARFFHLFVLLAVPCRRLFFFRPMLRALETIDSLTLRVPFVRRQAWMMVFTLERPRKS